jgi:hypothetical protein
MRARQCAARVVPQASLHTPHTRSLLLTALKGFQCYSEIKQSQCNSAIRLRPINLPFHWGLLAVHTEICDVHEEAYFCSVNSVYKTNTADLRLPPHPNLRPITHSFFISPRLAWFSSLSYSQLLNVAWRFGNSLEWLEDPTYEQTVCACFCARVRACFCACVGSMASLSLCLSN